MSLAEPQNQVLLFIPLGAIALYLLTKEEPENPQVEVTTVAVIASFQGTSKEANFLRFNNDSIYGNLLAAEEHFRNIKEDKNFNQCAVKHLCLAENHADEAVSHSIAVDNVQASEEYAKLRDEMRKLRHSIQDGEVDASKGIAEVRKIKKEFESFNPAFDVSRCKACKVE